MTPGRELDALVAEKVFGIKLKPSTPMDCDVCHKPFYSDLDIQPYSTSIASAWLVVEKLRDEHFMLEEIGTMRTSWKARFGMKWRVESGYAETAPHAICLAALKCVETK